LRNYIAALHPGITPRIQAYLQSLFYSRTYTRTQVKARVRILARASKHRSLLAQSTWRYSQNHVIIS